MSAAAALRAHLKKMTASKSSIHDATKAVSSYHGSPTESLGVIIQIMREVGQASKRVPYWYLMDSVAQYAKRKGNTKLAHAVLATVPSVIPIMLDPALGGDAKGEEAVTKVLDVWQRHKVYTGEEIAAALSKASAPQEPLVPRSPTLPPPADRHVTGPPLGDGALLPTPLLPTPVSVPTQPARTVVDTQLDRTAKLLLVFELDGTLIQLEGLSSGSYSTLGDVSADECRKIGYELEDALFRCLDENFWYRDMESRDKPMTAFDHVKTEDHSRAFPDTLLNDASVPPNVLHAQRYRAIRAYYNNTKPRPFATDSSSEMGSLLHAVHSITAGWSPEAKNILSALASKRDQVAIACVASQHIVEVLAKLMVFGFEDVIPIDLVYSSLDGQIDASVNDMMRRFNRDCLPVLVGSSHEMSDAAQRLGAKYFRVTDFNDVKDLPRYVESLLSQPPPPVPQPPFMPPPGYPPPSVPYGGGYPGFHGDALLPPPPPQPYMQEPARREDDRSRAPLWPDAPSREPQHQSSEFDRAPPREPRSGSGPFRATMCKFFLIGRCNRGDACTFAHDESQLRKGGSGGVPDSVRFAEESRRSSYDQPPPQPHRTTSSTSSVTNSGSGGVGSGSYGDRLLALGGSAPIEPVAEEKSASRKRSRWGGLADDASTPVAVEPYNPLEPSADSLRAAQALLNGGVGGLVMPTATGYALPMPPSQLGFMVNPPPAAPAMASITAASVPRPVMPTASASAPKRSNPWGNLGL